MGANENDFKWNGSQKAAAASDKTKAKLTIAIRNGNAWTALIRWTQRRGKREGECTAHKDLHAYNIHDKISGRSICHWNGICSVANEANQLTTSNCLVCRLSRSAASQRDKRGCKLYGDYSAKGQSVWTHNKRCNTVAMCYLVSCQKERIRHNAHAIRCAKRKFNHRLSCRRSAVLYTPIVMCRSVEH